MTFGTMRLLFALMALAANAVVLAYVVLWVLAKRHGSAARIRDRAISAISGLELWLAFGVAAIATLGSLYLSEIVGLVPCRLCWFQRVFMYPLVPILAVAAWTRDGMARRYVMVLVIPGSAFSVYHYAIQHFPGLEGGSCDVFAPCSAAYIWMWGFVSIPYMALSAFLLVVVLTFSLGRNMRMLSWSTQEGDHGQPADSNNSEAID